MEGSLRQSKVAQSLKALRSRVDRLFGSIQFGRDPKQTVLALKGAESRRFSVPSDSLSGFIDFLAAAMPGGEVYLFGGVLRDLALYGKRGFDSDIDMVVEGPWNEFVLYLESIGASKNKFGGYRLHAGDWPIDIWNAEETWAIRKGLVLYDGISSLTKTTIVNWDAILMNWRSKAFVCDASYLESLRHGNLELVLEDNPNPLGAAVRVLRHISAKDAKRVGRKAASYLERVTRQYSFAELWQSEMDSYRNSLIDPVLYQFFAVAGESSALDLSDRLVESGERLKSWGKTAAWRQLDLIDFDPCG